MDHCDVQNYESVRASGTQHILLDVRELDEWEFCHIEGAVHIPLGQLPDRHHEIPTDVPVYCLCHHGMRSQMAGDFLMKQGYTEIVNISGGIDAWSQAVDQNIPRY